MNMLVIRVNLTTSSKSDQWPKQAPHPMNMLVIRVNLTTSSKSDQWPKQAPHPMNMLVIRVNLINHFTKLFLSLIKSPNGHGSKLQLELTQLSMLVIIWVKLVT